MTHLVSLVPKSTFKGSSPGLLILQGLGVKEKYSSIMEKLLFANGFHSSTMDKSFNNSSFNFKYINPKETIKLSTLTKRFGVVS